MRRTWKCRALSIALVSSLVAVAAFGQEKTRTVTRGPVSTVTIDNGVVGDGFWEAVVAAACDTDTTNLDPIGLPLENVTFELTTYFDNGADGGGVALRSTVSSGPTLSNPGEVTSSGRFVGPNNAIDWTATCTIPSGTVFYEACFDFASAEPFGDVRLVNYYDEDVLGVIDNLVVLGTPGADDFELLTLDTTFDLGVGHTATYNTGTNVTYVGWGADSWPSLLTEITGPGASFSVAGVVDTGSLVPNSDPRYPADPAYGPNDITEAFAFDLNPAATSASVCFALGGSLAGEVPGEEPMPTIQVPISPTGLGALALLLLAGGWMVLRQQR